MPTLSNSSGFVEFYGVSNETEPKDCYCTYAYTATVAGGLCSVNFTGTASGPISCSPSGSTHNKATCDFSASGIMNQTD